jgi:Domain of unknown function (DUF4412)
MKTTGLFMFVLFSTALAARADFSYTSTRKTTGGMMAGLAGGNNQPSKYYFKGQKMKMDSGDTAIVLDFDAQTITTINNNQKTISVKNFNDLGAAAKQSDTTVKIDVKETGQKKTINGYNASELIMTMEIDNPALKQMGGKMQMEMDMWLSSDVPGAGELHSFYQKNMTKFPWAALGGGGNQGMQAGLAELQRKVAEMNGVQVLEVMKMKSAGGAAGAPAMPQMTAAQTAQMADAMAKLQAMQKQGGPAAEAAAQAMARMGSMQGGASQANGGASSSLMEMTMESTGFSTASIPDSVFAIPSGYPKN